MRNLLVVAARCRISQKVGDSCVLTCLFANFARRYSALPCPWRPGRRVPVTLLIRGSRASTSSQRAAPLPRNLGHRLETPASLLPAFPTPRWKWIARWRTRGELVVLFGGCEPYSVVCRLFTFVPEDQCDSVFHVDCETAEHRASIRRQRSYRAEHELPPCVA